MPIPSALYSTTDIESADIYMTEDWAPSCTKTPVRLYTTGSISSATTWNNQPPWASSYRYQDAAFGHSGCGYYKNDITWDVTSTIAAVAGHQTTQTFGLRAADESDTSQWKKFWSGSSNITMTVAYNYHPNAPDSLSTSPGGSCHTSSSDPAQIGNDDVTFSAYVSDNDGDDALTTEFVIDNASGGPAAYDSATAGTNVATGDKTDAGLTLPRATIQAFHTDGGKTTYTYDWQAQTTNAVNLTSGWSAKCWFTYNPQGPSQPSISGRPGASRWASQPASPSPPPPAAAPPPSPARSATPTSSEPAPPSPSPTSPATTGAGPSPSPTKAPSCSASTAHPPPGTSAKPPHSPSSAGRRPTRAPAPYPDGYFHGGPYPDLLTTGSGANAQPLAVHGSGNGTLNPPLDIGSLGTGINAGTGTDGPADWSGTELLHGDFTGDGVQDLMAYYPPGTATQGTGMIIGGSGDQSPLVPDTANTYTIQPYRTHRPQPV